MMIKEVSGFYKTVATFIGVYYWIFILVAFLLFIKLYLFHGSIPHEILFPLTYIMLWCGGIGFMCPNYRINIQTENDGNKISKYDKLPKYFRIYFDITITLFFIILILMTISWIITA